MDKAQTAQKISDCLNLVQTGANRCNMVRPRGKPLSEIKAQNEKAMTEMGKITEGIYRSTVDDPKSWTPTNSIIVNPTADQPTADLKKIGDCLTGN